VIGKLEKGMPEYWFAPEEVKEVWGLNNWMIFDILMLRSRRSAFKN